MNSSSSGEGKRTASLQRRRLSALGGGSSASVGFARVIMACANARSRSESARGINTVSISCAELED